MSKEFQIKDLKPMTSIKIPKELIGKGCRFISEEDYVEYLRMKETEYYVKQCGLKEKDQQIAELKQQLMLKPKKLCKKARESRTKNFILNRKKIATTGLKGLSKWKTNVKN